MRRGKQGVLRDEVTQSLEKGMKAVMTAGAPVASARGQCGAAGAPAGLRQLVFFVTMRVAAGALLALLGAAVPLLLNKL